VTDVTGRPPIRRLGGTEQTNMREVRRRRRAVVDAAAAQATPDGPGRSRQVPYTPVDAALRAIGQGDALAFASLYDECSPSVYGLIRRIVRDRAQSDEVLQEVMLEIWRLAPRFDPGLGTAWAWIMTIAHRRAVDRVRSEVADRTRIEKVSAKAVTAPPASAHEEVVDELDRQRVRVALGELTELQRSSIELAYFGGLSQSEIATLLDVPLGTVKTRIRDGLIRLRDSLGEGR
jgi:RNA polymerase sigma-70 factor, ECF subfamily